MKARIAALHIEAERTGIVSDILKSTVSRQAYLCFLHNLLPVYAALESDPTALSGFPALESVFGPPLFRAESIQADVFQISGGKDWQYPVVFDETRAYCAAIMAASKAKSTAFIGHIYVRYLGDLNGGVVLKKLVGTRLALSESALCFYEFPEIEDLVSFRHRFREAINTVSLSQQDIECAVQGAWDAFSWNIKISKAVKDQHALL